MAEGQLCWENRNLIIDENLKLAMAQKPTPSSSILAVYARLNQSEWVCSLCGGAQSQQKINITYGVFSQKNKEIYLYQTQIMKQLTSSDSLSLNLWGRSALPNSPLF